jgi:hypothetical protein
MITKTVELTDLFNWGKFLVCRFDPQEWAMRSSVDNLPLLRARGWTERHLWVLDLQTGEGAMFLPGGQAAADLEKHRIWVCPMFEVFLEWLYEHPQHWTDIHTLPSCIQLDRSKTAKHNALYGYRRTGPPDDVIADKECETKLTPHAPSGRRSPARR